MFRPLRGVFCFLKGRGDLLVMAEQEIGAGARGIFEDTGITLVEGLTPKFWQEADGLICSLADIGECAKSA